MVGNQLEQDIIKLYNKDITSLYSINQIAKLLNKKYPYINKKVTLLVKNNILKKTIVGRSHLCTPNLESDEAIWLLALNEIHKKQQSSTKQTKDLEKKIRDLKQIATVHLVLKTKKNTIYVVQGEKDKEILGKSQEVQKSNPKILSKKGFQDEILEKKTILEDHIILTGYEKYYQYIREIEEKLRIKYSPLLK